MLRLGSMTMAVSLFCHLAKADVTMVLGPLPDPCHRPTRVLLADIFFSYSLLVVCSGLCFCMLRRSLRLLFVLWVLVFIMILLVVGWFLYFCFIVTAAGVSDAFLMTRVTADIHSAVGCHALESCWLVYQNRNEPGVHCPHCPLSCRPICLPRISQQSIRYLSSACLHLAALFGWLSVMILRKRSLTTCGLPRNVSAVMPVT